MRQSSNCNTASCQCEQIQCTPNNNNNNNHASEVSTDAWWSVTVSKVPVPNTAQHLDVSSDVYTAVMLMLFGCILVIMLYRSMNWSNENDKGSEDLPKLLVSMRYRQELEEAKRRRTTMRTAKKDMQKRLSSRIRRSWTTIQNSARSASRQASSPTFFLNTDGRRSFRSTTRQLSLSMVREAISRRPSEQPPNPPSSASIAANDTSHKRSTIGTPSIVITEPCEEEVMYGTHNSYHSQQSCSTDYDMDDLDEDDDF